MKPRSQTVVRDEGEETCVHCKSATYQDQKMKLYRCSATPCQNLFHHLCNGKDGFEDAGSSRCSFCVKKAVIPAFTSDLSKEDKEKDGEVVDLDKEDEELNEVLV